MSRCPDVLIPDSPNSRFPGLDDPNRELRSTLLLPENTDVALPAAAADASVRADATPVRGPARRRATWRSARAPTAPRAASRRCGR
jgi:hypothetical protein